ncbi:MAG: hypothetical protein CMJ83_04385 [Planctomycetes bacterium]|nr:hypothetical protein [Planctomycetota bacterium]
MVRRIEKDHQRFRQIVRGRIKRDLRKYISKGELLGRQGKDTISIPIPQIELPHFTFDTGQQDGVGQGNGEPGDPVDGEGQGGPGEAGEGEGQHTLEVDVQLDELARILGEELELPNILPRGNADVVAERDRYTGIRRVGPEGLRHFKRTYREALKRQIAAGTYDPENPVIIPIREDRRYRSWNVKRNPEYRAVIVYMMDVSGSMGTEQKEMVRIEAFWIDTWLRYQYKNLQTVYIVHDAVAKEVNQHEFFHLRESGGTKISSAYQLCMKIIEDRFGSAEWNIYPFHFSDGDNWSGKDTSTCIHLLREKLLPISNVFCYGQVKSAYGSGQFKRDLDQAFGDDDRLLTSGIPDRDGILASIKDFLGKGR